MSRLHAMPIKQDKTIVELYKAKKFVADSLASVYASHTKVAPNGLLSTYSVSGIEDRHLTASPDLPSLLERSSKSENKDLYDLCLLLLDKEGYESDCSGGNRRIPRQPNGQDSVHQVDHKNARAYTRNQVEQFTAEEVDEKQGGNWKRSPSIPNMGGSRKKNIVKTKLKKQNRECTEKIAVPLNSKPYRKLSRQIPESNVTLCAEPVITAKKQPKIQETFQKRWITHRRLKSNHIWKSPLRNPFDIPKTQREP
ncbi:hypothetical protein M5D96_008374 [Drosophila gunungcola]|uniref:Uncharacterized protein n=1 Tax=Drosophila gunungcola TaxID=103775 RepID=A0A9P9YKD8_9MUSC|nr:hypothetical protein M5D96_008374 [Drosophila gunungcola]